MPKPDTTSSNTAQEGLIRVDITATMEREFQRRNMFPEMRLQNALGIINGSTGVYSVSAAHAREILEDAKAMRQKAAELPRGVPKSYTALVEKLTTALRQEARRGTWDLPSVDEMKRRLSESFARFDVGDRCLYFRDESEEYGVKVKIVQGLDLYQVRVEGGHFIGEHGRFEFLMGYVIQEDGCEPFFCPPYQLTRDDCKPSYLRLVAGLDVQRAQCHA